MHACCTIKLWYPSRCLHQGFPPHARLLRSKSCMCSCMGVACTWVTPSKRARHMSLCPQYSCAFAVLSSDFTVCCLGYEWNFIWILSVHYSWNQARNCRPYSMLVPTATIISCEVAWNTLQIQWCPCSCPHCHQCQSHAHHFSKAIATIHFCLTTRGLSLLRQLLCWVQGWCLWQNDHLWRSHD